MASVIKIKRSGTTTAPTSLASGELAYSWEASTGGKIYIGYGAETVPGEADSIAAIGGKYYTDLLRATPGALANTAAILTDVDGKIDIINIDNITIDGNSITSTNLNGNITISPDGTGSVDVDGSKIINVSNPSANTDAVNKQYVDSEIAALGASSDLDISGDTGTESVILASEVLNFLGGTGLSTAVTSNQIEFTLDDTTVVAGSYGSSTEIPVFTVDAQGRLTDANTVSISTDLSFAGDSGSDTVSLLGETLSVVGGTGITTAVSNNTITIGGDDATTTTKGVASFNATDFTVSSGAVSVNAITLGTSSLNPGETTTDVSGLTSLVVDDLTIDGNSISTANSDVILNPGGVGVIDASTSRIINVVDPVNGQDAATKEYVDTIASASLHYHAPVRVEAPTALNATYDNGTDGEGATLTNASNLEEITIDGITLSLNDRVLVYNQANAAHNGIYTVTTVGDGSTAWVLTRATDTDSYAPSDPDALGTGDAFYVKEGNTGAGELYVMTTEGAITFGTTGITFSQISAAQIYSAGDGLSLTGTSFSVNVDDSSIEINADTLRVKALGITNAMLAGSIANDKLVNPNVSISADTGNTDILSLGETITFAGGAGIDTTVSDNQVSIAVNTEAVQDIVGGMISGGTAINVDYFDVANNTIVVSSDIATTTALGVASFSSDNFAVSVGGEVTVTAVDGGTY